MTQDELKARLDALATTFARNVVAQDAEPDPVKGNAFARRYAEAFKELRKHGVAGRDALVPLLRDSRVVVRTTAAAFLLRHCTAQAIAVLEEAARGTGMDAFSAQQALERWSEGTWALDPE
jgi:hypothetical protein